MSGLDSFLTGFFGQVKATQDKNIERADNYFDEQMKRAQTVGLEKISERKARVSEANAVAARLIRQGNVPPDVVKEVARGGLEQLTQLEKIWADAASSGVVVDETYWRDVYGIAKNEAGQNGGDINAAIEEAVGLTKPQKMEAPKEKKKRSFGDVFFLNDSMENAQDRLETTMLEDGLSAADVLRMETDPTPTSTVGPNWSVTADREQEVRSRQKKDMTPAEVKSMNSDYDTKVDEYVKQGKLFHSFSKDDPDYDTKMGDIRREAERRAYNDMVTNYGEELVYSHPRFGNMEVGAEQIIPLSGEDVVEEEAPTTEAPVSPTVDESTRTPVTEVPDNVLPAINGPDGVYRFSHIDKSGKYTYKGPDGRLRYVDPKYVVKPNVAPVEATPKGQEVQERLNKALQAYSDGSGDSTAMDGLFVALGETPPTSINMPGAGVLILKQKTDDGYVYGLPDSDEQDLIIPSQ